MKIKVANQKKIEKIAFLLLIVSYVLPYNFASILQSIVWGIIAYITIKNFKYNKNITALILSTVIVIFIFILK